MQNNGKVEFIMFVGAPASGKTTLAKEYKERGYVVLSSDEVRAKMQEEINSGSLQIPQNTNLNSMVFDCIKSQTIKALQSGVSVVFDATNLGRRRRMNFRKSLYKTDCVQICYLFITPVEECLRRNALRTGYAKLPEESMQKMFCNFECPNYWEGWNEIIPIICKIPYSFDFSKIENLSQENHHHTLTLDMHMKKAYEYAVDNSFSSDVQITAKYHDVGKYHTKTYVNSRGEVTEEAHYYGHENFGAYLYLTENCCGKELTKEQFDRILYQTNLINCHMRPLRVWKDSERAKEKDKKLFGERFFKDLVDLNKCDRYAH